MDPFFQYQIYSNLPLVIINLNSKLSNRHLFHKILQGLENPDYLIFLIIPMDSYFTNLPQSLIHSYLIIILAHQHLSLYPVVINRIIRLIILFLVIQGSYFQDRYLILFGLNYFNLINLI